MSVNDAPIITIDDSRVMLRIVASLTDDSRGIIYNCNMIIVQATLLLFVYALSKYMGQFFQQKHILHFIMWDNDKKGRNSAIYLHSLAPFKVKILMFLASHRLLTKK